MNILGAIITVFALNSCVSTRPTPKQPELSTQKPTIQAVNPPAETPAPTQVQSTASAVPTRAVCAEEHGTVRREEMHSTVLPGRIVYTIYLPPCYSTGQKYPVLYWLHGLTFSDDQWIRLGAADTADRLIRDGSIQPLIMVLPYNSNSEGPSNSKFGDALALSMVPWIDSQYSTSTLAKDRWIGGLSRGGGWAFYIFTRNPGLFGAVGGHSPAIFFEYDPTHFTETIASMWQGERIWMDVGDQDKEVKFLSSTSAGLVEKEIPHVFEVNTGDHNEDYWRAHVEDYLRWYAGTSAAQ